MGACEYAPMMRLDHRYHYDLTTEKLDQLVAERRRPATAKPPASAQPDPFPLAERGVAASHTDPLATGEKPKKPRAPRKKKSDA